MKITKTQLKQIIKEELEAVATEEEPTSGGTKKWPDEYPGEAPAKLTTAALTPEEFVQMVKDWLPGAKKTEEQIFGPLGGEAKLAQNFANLKSRMESEGAGKLPRKYMPVVKKAFVEDLFNRLKAGKLDWSKPFAKSSKKAKGFEKAEKAGQIAAAGKETRMKKKKTRKKAQASIAPGAGELDISEQRLKQIIEEEFTAVLMEKFGYGRGDYSEEEREKFAQYLPSKTFPSLQDFDAMPDPEKSKSYWLNKGQLDGKEGDDILKPQFGNMSVGQLHPSQDVVYADKIAWKLLQYGPNVLAPAKDPGLGDQGTTPESAPDWRYRSIVIKGGALLDGHHKWALASLSGPKAKVPVLYLPNLDLPTTINLLRSYGATQGFAGQA